MGGDFGEARDASETAFDVYRARGLLFRQPSLRNTHTYTHLLLSLLLFTACPTPFLAEPLANAGSGAWHFSPLNQDL